MNASSAEFFKTLSDNYDQVDINGDGISMDEMQSYAKANGLSMPKPPRGEHNGPQAMSKDQLIEMLDKIAENGSNDTSALSQIVDNFDAADSNGDGQLSIDEVQAYAEANNIDLPKPSTGRPDKNRESTASDVNNEISAQTMQKILQQSLEAYSSSSANVLSESVLGDGVTA